MDGRARWRKLSLYSCAILCQALGPVGDAWAEPCMRVGSAGVWHFSTCARSCHMHAESWHAIACSLVPIWIYYRAINGPMGRAHGMLHAFRSRAGQIIRSDVVVLRSTIAGETERGEVGNGLPVPAECIQLKCKHARAGPD